MTTGSLGQGVSTAIGLCLGDKIQGRDTYTFLIVGDGELNEGQVWEGAQFAGHHKMDHLIAFCDYNKKQLDGYTADILDQRDIAAKFAAFGWDTYDVNGNDVDEVYDAIAKAKATPGKPHMIVLNTIKGAGVKAVEEMSANHHIVVSAELADQAIADLEKLWAEQKG